MNKRLKAIFTAAAIAVLSVITSICFIACDGRADLPDASYTITFDTDGGTEIQPIIGVAGSPVTAPADPQKSGHIFDGWYDNAARAGEKTTIPAVMPAENKTFYAKFVVDAAAETFVVKYEYNLGMVPHGGTVANDVGVTGSEITVKSGDAYGAVGYKFVGWSTSQNGVVAVTGEKAEGQYNAGDKITLAGSDITLYAQWAREYADRNGDSADRIYVYNPLVEGGRGAAILVRAGKPDAYGFVTDASSSQSGYSEFEFYLDGEVLTGRLYDGDYTYAVPDGNYGVYLQYDYITDGNGVYILALDGFGFATITEVLGSTTVVRESGYYEYDDEMGDYVMALIDPETGAPLDDGYGNLVCEYFTVARGEVADTEFDGTFMLQGYESGRFVLYDNGEILYNYILDLNGYGGARLITYDEVNQVSDVLAEGTYKGTAAYEDYYGEWQFAPSGTGSGVTAFNFILSQVSGGADAIAVYIEYNAAYNKTYTAADGSGDTLYLDGYGSAQYKSMGATYEGSATVSSSGNNITLIPYIDDGSGNTIAGGKMYFDVNAENNTFTVNTTGFISDGTTLTGYEGESSIVVIPDTYTAVADDAFNYVNTEVSLVSVTIPAGVTTIGARSFQNEYTLIRAIFLSTTPIAIDWTAGNDPFRWGAGNFIIVVPEGSQDAYKAAWSDCPHEIMGSEEVKIIPEFQVKDGVLVRYNGTAESGQLLDITLPDEVTSVADYVFRGLDFIRSVNLNNATAIGEGAFLNCSALTAVTGAKLQTIGDSAFAGCIELASGATTGVLEFPSVVSVGNGAFIDCFSLRRVVLGENLASIGDNAFAECNVVEGDPPLFVVLTGTTPPEIGEKATIGNIAFRFEVASIDVALKCFAAPGWNNYNRHLYIKSGDEAGVYISGADTLEIDGRAVFFSTETMLYKIDGEKITFYSYSAETATYSTVEGTYADGKITVTLDGKAYTFKQMGESATYTSTDGKYTITVDPSALLPENYKDNNGYADALLNGEAVRIHIVGYNNKTIEGYVDEDGRHYDISLTFDGDTFTYTKRLNETLNVTAADGSTLAIWFDGSLIKVTGELKITMSDGNQLPAWEYDTAFAQNPSENVFVFTRIYKNTTYRITVTVSGDTFTYTYEAV